MISDWRIRSLNADLAGGRLDVGLHRRHVHHHLPPHRKVDVRLPGKGNSNSYGARPVHLIITTIKRIRTSRLSIKNSLSLAGGRGDVGLHRRHVNHHLPPSIPSKQILETKIASRQIPETTDTSKQMLETKIHQSRYQRPKITSMQILEYTTRQQLRLNVLYNGPIASSRESQLCLL